MIRCEICKDKFDHSNEIGVYTCGHMVHLSCHQMYVDAVKEQNGDGSSSITCFSCRTKADSVIRCFPQLEEAEPKKPTERTKELQEQLDSLQATLINVMKDRIRALKEIDDFKIVLEQNHNYPSFLERLKKEIRNLNKRLLQDLENKKEQTDVLQRKYDEHVRNDNMRKAAAEETTSWSDID